MNLAQNTKSIFGTVKPPPGSEFAAGGNPLGKLITTGIQLFLLVAGLVTLIYLLWGGFDWITSSGDKEKLIKARQKIQNAFLGMIVIIAALVIFNVLVFNILGNKIIRSEGGGFQFNLPSLGGNPNGK